MELDGVSRLLTGSVDSQVFSFQKSSIFKTCHDNWNLREEHNFMRLSCFSEWDVTDAKLILLYKSDSVCPSINSDRWRSYQIFISHLFVNSVFYLSEVNPKPHYHDIDILFKEEILQTFSLYYIKNHFFYLLPILNILQDL